jgi:hypothetical protein
MKSHFLNYGWFLGSLLIITGLLYFIKTFKYKRINPDDFQEDDNLSRPSISTQTSSTGINNDNLPSAFTVNQEMNHIQWTLTYIYIFILF